MDGTSEAAWRVVPGTHGARRSRVGATPLATGYGAGAGPGRAQDLLPLEQGWTTEITLWKRVRG